MKNTFLTVLVIAILLTTGCAAKITTGDADSYGPPTSTEDAPKTTPLSAPASVSSASAAAPAKPRINTKDIKGKIKNIFYSDSNEVIILADKLYLYDLSKGKILAKADLPTTAVASVRPVKNGYVAIGENDPRSADSVGGMTAAQKSSGAQCSFYDKNLKFVSAIAINAIHKTNRRPPISGEVDVSDDGNKIAFSISYEGLYIYDISKKQKSLLIAAGSENPAGITEITKIRFTNSGKSIAFQAFSFDIPLVSDKGYFSTCGVINADGTGLVNNKTGDFSLYEITNCYNGFALFSEDFRSPTGRFLKMDTKSGKITFLKASDKKETSYAVGSDNGGYYATAASGKTAYTVRIYETATGKLISEQKAAFGEELYSFRAPLVKVIDASRTCIILLGNTQSDEYPTKMFINQF